MYCLSASDTGCSGAMCAPATAGLLHAADDATREHLCNGLLHTCPLESLEHASSRLATLARLPPCSVGIGRRPKGVIM